MELKPWHPLILIGLALVLSASSAKGQGPKQGTEQSGNAQNPPKQHSKPTKPTPTALIRSLTVVSTAASTPESNYQRYYPKDSAELAAWVQAASAVVLILFGGLQMYLLRRSTSATENAALAARDNAMAAKDMAEANVKSAEAAKEQADIAKKTLALSQRPRLIVRNVVVKPVADFSDEGGPIHYFVQGSLIDGQFYVANIGGGTAYITESLCIVHWREGPLPMSRPYEGDNGNNPIGGHIEPGGRLTGLFQSSKPLNINHMAIVEPKKGAPILRPHSLYVMGWIEYNDELGVERRTAFCRKFDPQISRFVPVNDPDYEHAE